MCLNNWQLLRRNRQAHTRPPNPVRRQNLSRHLTSVEPAGQGQNHSVTQRPTKNAHELQAREKCVQNVYVKSRVVSLLNYARRQEDVWEEGGTTPRILYLGHYIYIYGDDRSASRPDASPSPRKDTLTSNRWRTLGRDFVPDSVARRKTSYLTCSQTVDY
jgi:hypothetical protein